MATRKKLCKIVMLGDSEVGKTSVLHQFVDERFSQQYRATVGADLMTKEITVDGQTVTLQIWDTAGQERFQNLGGQFYKGSDLCVLTFDITKTDSLKSLDTWKASFLEYAAPEDQTQVSFIVLGNKVDRPDRQVPTEAAQKWCKDNGDIEFFEVSAKENTGIKEAFDAVARTVLKKSKEEETYDPRMNLSTHKRQQSEKKCAC